MGEAVEDQSVAPSGCEPLCQNFAGAITIIGGDSYADLFNLQISAYSGTRGS